MSSNKEKPTIHGKFHSASERRCELKNKRTESGNESKPKQILKGFYLVYEEKNGKSRNQ